MGTIIKLVTLILAIEMILFIVISSIPVNNPEVASEAEKMINDIASQPNYLNIVTSIFTNNIIVTGISFIPVVGIGFLGYAIYNTGYALSALSTSQDLPGSLVALLLFISPHSVTEFLSYAISSAAGLILIWKRKVRTSLYMFGISVLDLFVAAMIEGAILYDYSLMFILWLPTLGFIALVFILLRKIERGLQGEGKGDLSPTLPPPLPPSLSP
ncbi:MAG: stage II sporulation protein M [Sulfolobaceae archaeon]